MQNKIGVLLTGIIGLIVILFTVTAFFLMEIEKTPLNFWALAFLLLSEIVLFTGLICLRFAGINQNKVFLRSGIISALFMYFFATLISMLFIRGFKENLNIFILIQLAIIMLFAIIIISVFAFSMGIERRNQEDIKKVGNIEPKRGGF